MVVILFTRSETLLKLCTYIIHWIIFGKRLINLFIRQRNPHSNIYCFFSTLNQLRLTVFFGLLWTLCHTQVCP